jgi:hypothetical protein
LVIGLRFRVTLLLVAASIMTALTVGIAVHAGWSVTHTIGVLVLLLAIQQGSYVIGILASLRR